MRAHYNRHLNEKEIAAKKSEIAELEKRLAAEKDIKKRIFLEATIEVTKKEIKKGFGYVVTGTDDEE